MYSYLPVAVGAENLVRRQHLSVVTIAYPRSSGKTPNMDCSNNLKKARGEFNKILTVGRQ